MDPAATLQIASASVASLAERLKAFSGVTSYTIVEELLQTHAYGGRSPGELGIGEGSDGAKRKSVFEWLREAGDVYNLAEGEFLDGRRVILGLALMEKHLFAQLSADGFLEALQEELAQSSGLQLSAKGKRLAARQPTRVTIPVLDDAPAEEDELGRAILAHVLAGRIRRARGDLVLFGVLAIRERFRRFLSTGSLRLRRASSGRAVLFHIDGPWGAGKSSLLNFIARELRGPDLPKADRWVVVTFSAWKYQRVEPPWWWLTIALHESGVRGLWSINLPRAVAVGLLGVWWRIRDGWAVYIVLGASVVGAFFLWRAGFFGNSLKSTRDVAESLAKIAAFAALAWGAIKALNRWLLTGMNGTGASVLERSRDPLRLMRSRFARLVRSIRHPVVIFIDDLDRCEHTYVVQLLEGIQTLFIDEPVVYVVAADGRWLSDAYVRAYSAEGAGEPGRPLGGLFLEKAFQHTVRLARIPDDARERYWKGLLGEKSDARPSADANREAQHIFEPLATAGDILDTLREHEKKNQIDPYALRFAAARALEAKCVEANSRSMLDHFYGLLEDNPRTMKKLLNAYGIELESRLPDLPGDDETLRKLALWTIVSLRWPLLAEYLATHPDEVENVGSKAAIPADVQDNRDLEPVFCAARVHDVIKGKNVQPPVCLDPAAIRLFVGASMVAVTPANGDGLTPASPS